MVIYLCVLAFTVLCSELAVKLPARGGLDTPRRRPNIWFVLLAAAAMAFIAGSRDGVGTDYGNYIDIYSLTIPKTYADVLGGSEPLFALIVKLSADIFGGDRAMFAIFAAATVVIVSLTVRRSSSNFTLSMFLYIAAMYYFDAFNGMRQALAGAVLLAGYPLMAEKKFLPYLLTVLIAYCIHASSLMMLAVMLLANTKPFSAVSFVITAVFALMFIMYDTALSVMFDFLARIGSRYSDYDSMLTQEGEGANILRFLLAMVPVVMSAACWRVLKNKRPDVGVLVNLSLYNALFMLLAYRHWMFARYSMFLGLYNLLLWPEIAKCFDKKSRRILVAVVVCVYLAYMILITPRDSNLLPYKSWLFSGVWS